MKFSANKLALLSFVSLLFLVFVEVMISPAASALSGSDFSAGDIIADSVFYNAGTMSVTDIQNFLNSKVPSCDTNGTQMYNSTMTRAQYSATQGISTPFTCLENYYENPTTHANNLDGNAIPSGAISAAQIIYNAAQQYTINPQVLIVLLQKEQGLVLDTWPWDSEYTEATGYGCPDSSPNCASQYSGFYNQVENAAWQFRQYQQNPSTYNFLAGSSNFIQYNPNSTCGGSNVTIQTQSTAGLYDYTPYQPDQAALNNLTGSGDSCSSYGNRNFWYFYNEWFGSSTSGVEVITPTGGQGLFAYYNGQKQLIQNPSAEVAWGLDKLPVVSLSQTTMNSIPNASTNLGIYAINPLSNPNQNPAYMVADGGGTFDATPAILQDWSMSPSSASVIGIQLIAYTSRLGNFSVFASTPNVGCVFMVDGGTTHCFANPTALTTWAGPNPYVITISSNLYSSLTSGGAGVFNGQASSNSNSYFVDSGHVFNLPGNLAQIYPNNSQLAVSSSLISALPNNGNATRFIASPGIGGIYLADSGKVLPFASPAIMNSFVANSESGAITTLSSAGFNSFTTGNPITNRFVYNSSNSTLGYYLNKTLTTLTNQFADTTYGTALSPATLSYYTPSASGACSSNFISSNNGSSGIYLMDNGSKRPIANPTEYNLLNNNPASECALPQEDFSAIPSGPIIRPLVSNNGTNYLIENGQYYAVTAAAQQAWQLSGYVPIGTSLLNSYNNGGNLSSDLSINGQFEFVTAGTYYSTMDSNIAGIWGITSPQSHTPIVTSFLRNGGSLSQFAVTNSTSQPGIYLVDQGKFIIIPNPDDFFNAGYKGQNLVTVDAGYLTANLASGQWQGYLATDATSGNTYILEGGYKHLIPAQQLTKWVGSPQTVTPSSLSTQFLNLLLNGAPIGNSFAAANVQGIFAMSNGSKFVIPNYTTYQQSYAPYLQVTDHLINSIP